tara:strand:+ start:10872 stop:11114 length:243 start_codon:yes stop_codon:yes gene_type:complete
MALVKATLKAAIKAAFEAEKESTDPAATSIDRIATAISDAVDVHIRSATLTVPAGIPVATAGSPTAQVGATTAPALCLIS